MSKLEISLLGPPEFRRDGTAFEFRLRKATALLAYLAVSSGRQSRSVLTNILYPDKSGDTAFADFRQVLYILGKTIGKEWLDTTRNSVAIVRYLDVFIDAKEFERLLNESCNTTGTKSDELDLLTRAVGHYRDDFLIGFHLKDSVVFDDWQLFEREHFRREYANALHRLAQIHESSGDLGPAIECTSKLLALDSLDEGVHRRLMRLFAISGNRSAAMRQYDECRSLLEEELGQLPDEETDKLRDDIQNQRVSACYSNSLFTVKPRTLSKLPAQTTALIGRRHEVRTLAGLLKQKKVRAVTLTGPAGAGKTTLGLKTAMELVEHFEQGVFFVDLAPLRNSDQVIATVARALGLRETTGGRRSLREVLHSYLSNKKMLLMLDNFEHVMAAAEEIADLLQIGPELKVLITSREPLLIRAEHQFGVSSLGLPATGDGHRPSQLRRCPSVRLFVERAARLNRRFVISDSDTRSIAEICVKLDGLPLAIELAASCLAELPLHELAERCRLDLPTHGYRDLPVRQRSLRSAIDWSYNLLNATEQQLFAWFAVFPGGFYLDAALRVCSVIDETTRDDVVRAVASLVRKNLLKRGVYNGESRFWMLKTILEYATGRLEYDPSAEHVRKEQADYFVDLAESLAPQLYAQNQLVTLERLSQENANLQAALKWLVGEGRNRNALRMGIALHYYWFRRGEYRHGREWLEKALSLSGATKHHKLNTEALSSLGIMMFHSGDWSRARALWAESLALFEQLGDRANQAAVLSNLGVVERWLGEYEQGVESGRSAIEMAREVGDNLLIAQCLTKAYGTTGGKFVGSPPRAELEEALRRCGEHGDLWGIAHCFSSLGDLYVELGDAEAARKQYDEVMERFQLLDEKWMIAWTYDGLGNACRAEGKYGQADGFFRRALELFAELGDDSNSLLVVGRIAMTARLQGDHRRAACLLGAYRFILNSTRQGGDPADETSTAEMKAAIADYRASQPADWARGEAMTAQQAVQSALSQVV